MRRRLSTYPKIVAHRKTSKNRKVDSYTLRELVDGARKVTEVHIIHEGGCQRAMTADGLCFCLDPETFEIDVTDREPGRWRHG